MRSAAGKASGYNSETPALGWSRDLSKRIWLPKALYLAVPFFYLGCAICAVLATLFVTEWFWLVPHYLLFSFACVHVAVFVVRRRPRNEDTDPPL